MSHVALTVLAPVRPERHAALVAALDGLPEGVGSPLAQVPGLHLGRITTLERLADPRGASAPVTGPFLLVSVDADGPREAVVTALIRTCGRFFAACVDCPDPADQRAMGRWLKRHRVKDRWTIMPYAGRTVDEVREGLATRERLGRFAVIAEQLEPAALRRAFLEEFGR